MVVAAADGWIRFIVDSNTGHTTGNNFVWIEHPAPYCQAAGVTWPGKPANYKHHLRALLGRPLQRVDEVLTHDAVQYDG